MMDDSVAHNSVAHKCGSHPPFHSMLTILCPQSCQTTRMTCTHVCLVQRGIVITSQGAHMLGRLCNRWASNVLGGLQPPKPPLDPPLSYTVVFTSLLYFKKNRNCCSNSNTKKFTFVKVFISLVSMLASI